MFPTKTIKSKTKKKKKKKKNVRKKSDNTSQTVFKASAKFPVDSRSVKNYWRTCAPSFETK